MIGQIISHYKILEHLGSGGMGEVYKAEDISLKRTVALKFLPVNLAGNNEAKERFIQEARAASSLDHPNICTIYEINETDHGQIFIAMAYYEGETLNKKIRRGPLNFIEILQIGRGIAEGLKRAHEAGIIHRDIKAGNIIITVNGDVKILDFGLAKISGQQSRMPGKEEISGTLKYMSPEQINGDMVDHRTDIWSLGVVLYELTAGTDPFKGEYEQAVIYSILNENPSPLKYLHPGVPAGLEALINKCLSRELSGRYENMNDLLKDLVNIDPGNRGINDSRSIPGPEGEKDHRRLAAIMFTDMVGYSALMQNNEALALNLLKEHREILRSLFPQFDGTEIETAGDSFFVEFISAVDAAKCAVEIQRRIFERNLEAPAGRKILLRIGLHVGDVIHTEKHVHGDGVNLAARLEPLAQPGSICISEDAARQIKNKIDYEIISLGKHKVKNFNNPINVYKIKLPWENNQNVPIKIKKINFAAGFKIFPVVSLFVLLIIAVYFIWRNTSSNLSVNPSNRIAVLPFINISQESSNEYFAEGITEEIISNLAKISGLDVIARTSIMKYKNSNLNVSQIADELNVGTILEGSVRKAENKARITVQLVDASTQKHLWSEDYDRELKDIFAIQSDIAMKVAEELKVQLLADEKLQIVKKGTENSDAYRNYLLGNYYLNKRTGEDLTKGAGYLNKAVEFDPGFALAYAALANCYTLLGGASYGNLTREEAEIKAKESVLKALEIDGTLAEAHAANGYIKFRFDWNWEEAEKEFTKAIELKPGYAQAHEWFALFLALIRKSDKALDEMNRAFQLDPLSPSISTGVGRILHLNGKEKDAILQLKKTNEMYPNYAEAHFALGMSYMVNKNYNEALNEMNSAINLSHNRPVIVAVRGLLYGLMGNRKKALASVDEVINFSKPNPVSPIVLSNIYIGLGDYDKVFELFDEGFRTRDPLMVYIPSEPFYGVHKMISSDPRYRELLRKMDLHY